jgi:hypothetical protein
MPFENRAQAAHMLRRRLEQYRGQHPLVLAIPRGAVPMGKILAEAGWRAGRRAREEAPGCRIRNCDGSSTKPVPST